MQTFTFTIEQIKEIYDAGIKRGSDEATAFDWGCSPTGDYIDNCVEAVFYIVNGDKVIGGPDTIDYSTVEEWFK